MAEWVNGPASNEMHARRAHRVLSIEAFAVTALVAVVVLAAVHVFGKPPVVDTAVMGMAMLIYAAVAVIALAHIDAHRHSHFGAANAITTIRAAITSVLGGLVLVPSALGEDPVVLWTIGFVVALALALDGIDGYLARRFGTASAFGARFDMEVDALLILFLSLAAFLLGKAGIWILLIGFMRYLYLAAQALFPRLRGELPPSMRRKAICVMQGAMLCLLLLPIVVPPLSTALAAFSLLFLTWSFCVDGMHLARATRRSLEDGVPVLSGCREYSGAPEDIRPQP